MSKEAVEGFYRKVLQDAALQDKFRTAPNEEAFVQLAVDLGAKHGFSFTAAEVRARLKEEAGKLRGELSDRELEAVAGGAVSLGSSILCGYCGSQSGTSRDSRTTKLPS